MCSLHFFPLTNMPEAVLSMTDNVSNQDQEQGETRGSKNNNNKNRPCNLLRVCLYTWRTVYKLSLQTVCQLHAEPSKSVFVVFMWHLSTLILLDKIIFSILKLLPTFPWGVLWHLSTLILLDKIIFSILKLPPTFPWERGGREEGGLQY